MIRRRQRPVSERYDYNYNKRLSLKKRILQLQTQASVNELVAITMRRDQMKNCAKVNPKTMLWQSCGLDKYNITLSGVIPRALLHNPAFTCGEL